MVLMLTAVLVGSTGHSRAQDAQQISAQVDLAMPAGPTDESKVPHYFGPNPNWANSPYTLADATVTISGEGSGATAVASVGVDGAITGITITDPGRGYTSATVSIGGAGNSALAEATVTIGGVVTAVSVDSAGSGYTAPLVIFEDLAGVTTPATAIAYGGVDAITYVGGSGYTMPTVDFDMPDAPDGVQARAHAEFDPITGDITAIVVDQPGSGYSSAPHVVIRDGTLFDPIIHDTGTFTASIATTTLAIQSVVVESYGDGYTTVPGVWIEDTLNVGNGTGAAATAFTDSGAITAITITAPGSGYVTTGGIKKFQDGLPKLCIPTANFAECADVANNLGQYLPIALADTDTFSIGSGFDLDADYYVIALVQHREQMHSDLPPTLLREYVQLETPANTSWSKHIALTTDLLDGTSVPTLMPDGTQAYAVDDPHFLGPVIVANKDKPVRIVFYNLLPDGQAGDLFLPTDSTIMGSGPGPMEMMPEVDQGSVMDGVRNPECTETFPKSDNCFADNRATLHLHGGITPWISDGTPHQWITPANETTPWPQGVSVEAVPDMINVPGVPDCSDPADGCMSFYYTNQQSARFMFYHDHAWGITRLNVYAGEAAGYVITDETDARLMAPGGPLADVGLGIPLVIQDRTFVPQDTQMYNQVDGSGNVTSYGQDPTWDASRWGGYGNFWYHHVYMPAQNPGDPSGMSAYGRWMYGPWFWPPATPLYGPIANPYYDPSCNLDVPATWQYDTDPFCEPQLIPGTPNISAGMEQFNDTPIVNGTAYPTTNVEPKAYRFRILNAANDRFWNLQWYVADASGTEVALNPAELAAAQIDPNIFPTPDTSVSPAGPSWIQIGSEGGFLPAPVVVPNQPITWIIDPTRFDVGNVDLHALLLAPAERADVIVDFSRFAGKTLILYNDAPAAFPARVSSYDYYTGGPDLSPVGAPTILPGYGPNTRTIMQVKVSADRADGLQITTYNLAALKTAFRHKADGSGVFESGQHPIIVGQAAYNSAYGTSFSGNSYCNGPGNTNTRCDGFLRILDQGGTMFGFNTLRSPNTKTVIKIEPKAIHDEMNSTAFDEFGRMTANIGVEAVPATPGLQNVVLYPYNNPATELIDATNLPKIGLDDINNPDFKVQAISVGDDGTQIWKITHNGVDTHPIHWHLYDVQVLNRVTWDNIILPPEPSELGWKDTLRVSPLEDTIVALRPIIPYVPFDLPNSVRPLNPMTPIGSQMGFNSTDPSGNPTSAIFNQLVNFGWEYVFHCHILSHEEMDMMRPVSVALPPIAPDGLVFDAGLLTWNDNSINETAFVVQRDEGSGWVDLATIEQPLHQPDPTDPANKGLRSYFDTTFKPGKKDITLRYRVVALNRIGYLDGTDPLMPGFPEMTVQSVSTPLLYDNTGIPPEAPILTAAYQSGPQILLNWSDTANETSFTVERSIDNGVTFTQIITLGTDITTYTDLSITLNAAYTYQVYATNAGGNSPMSNQATVKTPPNAPSNLTAVYQDRLQAVLNWTDNSSVEDGFIIERIEGDITTFIATLGPDVVTYPDAAIAFDGEYVYQVYAFNASGTSAPSNVAAVDPPPLAPTGLTALYQSGVQLTWFDNSLAETGFTIQRCAGAGCLPAPFATVGPLQTGNGVGNVAYLDTTVLANTSYTYQIVAFNATGPSDPSNSLTIPIPDIPAAPALGTITSQGKKITVNWTAVANVSGYTIQWSTDSFATLAGTGSAAANAASFTTPNLTRGTTYFFRIRADRAVGSSLWAYYPAHTP